MEFDVFLCYRESDRDAVKQVGQQLKARGLRPWLDEWELQPGKAWHKEIEHRLATIPAVAVFISATGIGPWQDQEVSASLRQFAKRGLPVIPVFLPGSVHLPKPELPVFLEGFTWVDFRKDDPNPLEQLHWGITGVKSSALSETPKPGSMPFNNLPFASLGDLLQGREELLSRLGSSLDPDSPTALVQPQTINGLGGVGKTRLAVEYAYRHGNRYTAIFFVGADSDAELRRNLAGLAREDLLDLPVDLGGPEAALLTAVRKHLRDHPGWLLILDNVDTTEAQDAVRRLLPLSGGQIVITSRIQHWPLGMKQLSVDALEPAAALAFLLKATEGKRRTLPNDDSSASELAGLVGCLPLALELTAAYVRVNGLSFASLLRDWHAKSSLLLSWYDPTITEYPRSLVATWTRTFERLSREAQNLLYLLAHLAPEPIEQSMIEQDQIILADALSLPEKRRKWSPLNVIRDSTILRLIRQTRFREPATMNAVLDRTLQELLRYSLISSAGEPEAEKELASEDLQETEQDEYLERPERIFILHRIVQSAALLHIASEDRPTWAELAVRLVWAYTKSGYPRHGIWYKSGRPHAIHAIDLALTSNVHRPTTELMHWVAGILDANDHHEEALSMCRRVLAIDEASFGPNDRSVSEDLKALADTLLKMDRIAEAEAAIRRALEIDQETLGQTHQIVARDLLQLGRILYFTGRLQEAEAVLRPALAIAELVFGEDESEIANYLANLAHVLWKSEQLAEVENLMRRALVLTEKRWGTLWGLTGFRLADLAYILIELDRPEEAEPCLRRALQIFEERLGLDSSYAENARENLATLQEMKESQTTATAPTNDSGIGTAS